MKKIMALVLVIALLFTLSVNAFAGDYVPSPSRDPHENVPDTGDDDDHYGDHGGDGDSTGNIPGSPTVPTSPQTGYDEQSHIVELTAILGAAAAALFVVVFRKKKEVK